MIQALVQKLRTENNIDKMARCFSSENGENLQNLNYISSTLKKSLILRLLLNGWSIRMVFVKKKVMSALPY